MFFRRERPKTPTFQERLEGLQQQGFTVTQLTGGGYRVSRGACAIDLAEREGNLHIADRAGVLLGNEIARLAAGGYQKIFRTASGKVKPALAEELKALHDFEEDL